MPSTTRKGPLHQCRKRRKTRTGRISLHFSEAALTFWWAVHDLKKKKWSDHCDFSALCENRVGWVRRRYDASHSQAFTSTPTGVGIRGGTNAPLHCHASVPCINHFTHRVCILCCSLTIKGRAGLELVPAQEFSGILQAGWHHVTDIGLKLAMLGIFYTMEIRLEKCYRSGVFVVLVVKYLPLRSSSKAIGDEDFMRACWFQPVPMLTLTHFILSMWWEGWSDCEE